MQIPPFRCRMTKRGSGRAWWAAAVEKQMPRGHDNKKGKGGSGFRCNKKGESGSRFSVRGMESKKGKGEIDRESEAE
jgi:hypothetical protein